jgi:hypothetical protein
MHRFIWWFQEHFEDSLLLSRDIASHIINIFIMVRKTMGIMTGEHIDCTTDKDENGSYSELLIPAPSLVLESHQNFPIKWYFGTHIIISSVEYFLIFGDQIENTVFICAVHEVGKHLPTGFICLDADAFHKWLKPTEGNKAVEPPCEAWGFYDAIQFCTKTMKSEDSDTVSYNLKVCVETKEAFEEAILSMIAHVMEIKVNPAYSFMFLATSKDSSNHPDAPSTDGSANSKLTKAQKAAKTREENKNKAKEKFVPKRGQVVAGYEGINPPFVNVNKIKNDIQEQGVLGKRVNPKGSGVSKKTTLSKKSIPNKKKGSRPKNGGKIEYGYEDDNSEDNNEEFDDESSALVNLPRPNKRSSKFKSEVIIQSVPQAPFETSILGSLTKATEALVNAIAAKEATEDPKNQGGKSMRTLLREEAEADHKLDHLKFMDKMVEAQAALNLKAGNPLPVLAMAQHQSTTLTTAPVVAPPLQENGSISQQTQQLVLPIGQAPAQMMMQASSPQILNGQLPQFQQQQCANISQFQMQYNQPWQSPQFQQQMQYQHQNLYSPAAQHDANIWASHQLQQQYYGVNTPQLKFFEGEDSSYYDMRHPSPGTQMFQRQHQGQMTYQQPNSWGNSQHHSAQSSSNQWASSSKPNQSSNSWSKK